MTDGQSQEPVPEATNGDGAAPPAPLKAIAAAAGPQGDPAAKEDGGAPEEGRRSERRSPQEDAPEHNHADGDGRGNGGSSNIGNGAAAPASLIHKSSSAAGEKAESDAETVILSGKEDGPKPTSRKTIKLEQTDPPANVDAVTATHDTFNGNNSKIVNSSNDSHQHHHHRHPPSNTAHHHRSPDSPLTAQPNDPASRLGNGRQSSLKRKRGAEEPALSDAAEDRDSSRLSSTVSSPVIERRTSDDNESKSPRSESSPPLDDAHHRRSPDAPAIRDHHKSRRPDPLRSKDTKDSVNGRNRRDTRSATDFDDSTNRSTSPPLRKPHRAHSSQSNQPPASGTKKRRKAPAPLHVERRSRPSEDANDSDSSSVRSHHRAQTVNSVETPVMWKSSKLSSKKNKDRSGRTLLARACHIGVEEVEKWLKERPEDIDVADNAGNTPLQIASLEGSADIVKLLVDSKCRVDCKNVDNDTPLIDAVENGHLEVVQLLLAAGADPTQRNATGKEPTELVNAELDDADAIREALQSAKKQKENRRKHSEDQLRRQHSASRDPEGTLTLNSGPSPTHSTRSPPLDPGTRRRTARSQHTNDSLLWVNPTPQRLRDAAGKGDMAIVTHILNMNPQADTEAVLAAAQGGHDEILDIILAIAQPEADPPPLRLANLKPGHTTPMLAAIGRGNVKVIKLLLNQPGFDPTRKFYKGLTYYELAKERQSSEWREEYQVLKDAYDQYKKHGGRKSHQSTPQKTRIKRNESRKSSAEPSSPPHEGRKVRKTLLGIKDEPDTEPKKKRLYQGTAIKSSDDKRRMSTASSDHELDVPRRKEKTANRVRSASPSHPVTSKPKRRLVSGNDVQIDRESRRKALELETTQRRKSGELVAGSGDKQRRPSDSSVSVPVSHKASSESPNRPKDDTGRKRVRNSVSPRNSRSDLHDGVKKKKRLRVDSRGTSVDQDGDSPPRPGPAPAAHMLVGTPVVSSPTSLQASAPAAPVAYMGSAAASTGKKSSRSSPTTEGTTLTAKSSSPPLPPTDPERTSQVPVDSSPPDGAAEPKSLDVAMKDAEAAATAAAAQEEARLQKEEQDRAAADARAKEEAEVQRQLQREKIEAERIARVAREEEEARREAERKLQREREEAEAALAKRRKEEELQRRRAEQERQRREEQERRHREAAEREALRLIRAQQEEERLRRESLPNGLRRYIELTPDEARLPKEISKWLPLRTVTMQDLDATCDPNVADERWITNIQAAPLLANGDLELSQCMVLPNFPSSTLRLPISCLLSRTPY